jgi:hypothetical protein
MLAVSSVWNHFLLRRAAELRGAWWSQPAVTQFPSYRRTRNKVAPALYTNAAISVWDKKDQVLDVTWELSGKEKKSFAATETTTSLTRVQMCNSLEYAYFSNGFGVFLLLAVSPQKNTYCRYKSIDRVNPPLQLRTRKSPNSIPGVEVASDEWCSPLLPRFLPTRKYYPDLPYMI